MSITRTHEFFIQLHLTERCNLSCSHCYQTGKDFDEMSLDEIGDLVAETAETLNIWEDSYGIAFSRSFSITGGEPFLRGDIFRIIEEIGNRGFETYVLSNGTLIDSARAGKLSELGVKRVQVSMEGPEKIHNKIRGERSYSSAIRGVQALLVAGVPVTLNMTLSEINADYIPDLVSLSGSLGVKRLGITRLVPSGRGAGLIYWMIGKERLRRIYEDLFSVSAGDVEIVSGDPVFSQLFSPEEGDCGPGPKAGCAAGLSGLTILPDGTIVPCRRLFIPIGNIRKDSLREIWAASEILNQLRDKASYKGKCGSCRRWAVCRGCRAIAYACSRNKGQSDFLTEDPQCFLTL